MKEVMSSTGTCLTSGIIGCQEEHRQTEARVNSAPYFEHEHRLEFFSICTMVVSESVAC
jgi:hypothetical protein